MKQTRASKLLPLLASLFALSSMLALRAEVAEAQMACDPYQNLDCGYDICMKGSKLCGPARRIYAQTYYE